MGNGSSAKVVWIPQQLVTHFQIVLAEIRSRDISKESPILLLQRRTYAKKNVSSFMTCDAPTYSTITQINGVAI